MSVFEYNHEPRATSHEPRATSHNCILKFFARFFKISLAFFISLIILTIFTNFYAGVPALVPNGGGATDMIHTPFVFYSSLKEGFSFGHFNNEGYNNKFNYENGISIDVLIMGASHMDGLEVMPEDNTTNILANLSGKKIYNIGMGTHFFTLCAKNLKTALKKYKPRFTIIETARVNFTDEELKAIADNNIQTHELARKTRGLLRSILRENSYLYLLYSQMSVIFQKQKEPEMPIHSNPVLLNEVLEKLASDVNASDAKLIIAYHPSVVLEKDGSMKILGDLEAVKIFADTCRANGIYFIDMSTKFLSAYQKDYTVPNGFFNSSVASGHLNKDGHRMFAEEIYKLMQKIEN